MTVKKNIFFIMFLLTILTLGRKQILFCAEETINPQELNDENARDPFVPVLPQKETVYRPSEIKSLEGEVKLPNFSVQGLIWGVDKPQAIIDDKVLNVGDEIEGAKVVEITKEGVKMSYQGKVFLIAPQITTEASKKQTGR